MKKTEKTMANKDEAKVKKGLGFTTKLAIGMMALSLLGFALMYLIVNSIVHDIIYDNVIGLAQRNKTIHANELDTWFAVAGQSVSSLGTALNQLEAEEDFEAIAVNFVSEYDFIQNIFIGFADEGLINGLGWVPPDDWTSTDRPWYLAATAAGVSNIGVTEPYWSFANENMAVAMSTWLPDLGGIGAAVGAAIPIDFVLNRVSEYDVMGGGYLVLVGSDGEIIAHPNPTYAPDEEGLHNIRDIPNGDFLEENVSNGMGFAVFDDLKLGPSYFITAPLDTVDWTLIAVIPVEATSALVSQNLLVIMISLALVLVVLFIFTMVVVSYLTRDMEERRVFDLRILKETLEERQRAETAEENNKAKTRFLARMSHEIRTPITAVLGISEIQLRNPSLDPAIEEPFAQIYNSSSILLEIVNDILDFSKIEAGKLSLINNEYEVASLVGDASQLHLVYLDEKAIDFVLHVDENLPAFLIGDVMRIRQIINNLLSNAFKYTESGTVTLELECRDNKDNKENKDSKNDRNYINDGEDKEDTITLSIIIRDTGLGMTKSQLESLQAKYTSNEYMRFHEEEYRGQVGTGLGMPIVFSLTEMMGAEIKLESEVNKGTSVYVDIPQKTSGSQLLGKEVAANLESLKVGTWSTSKKFDFVPEPMPYGKVLIVDDVYANLYVAQGLLSFYELKIETATNGQEAIDKIKDGNVYDVIFMDQMMPGLTGTETTHKLRKMGYNKPIVALTANAIIGQAEEFMKNGFDGFISKPIQTINLNTILVRFVRNKHPKGGIEPVGSLDTGLDKIKQADASLDNAPLDNGLLDNPFLEDPEVLAKLRKEFVKNQGNVMEELYQAMTANDIKTTHRLVHTLKGLAALIGEKHLEKMAQESEMLLKNGKIPEAHQLEALKNELFRVTDEIERGD